MSIPRSAAIQREIDEKKGRQAVFLSVLRGEDGKPPQSIRIACREAGVSRTTVKHWRQTDPEFLERFEDAFDDGTDTMEDVANDWAMNGRVEEREFGDDGEVTSERIKHDSAMMRFILGGRRPQRYRQGGDVNVQVNSAVIPADDNQISRALSLLLAQAKAKQVA